MSSSAVLSGTPCEAAIDRAMQLARQILNGEIDPFDGGRQIAWLGTADCYDFLNEVDVVDEMGGFWSIVDHAQQMQSVGLPPMRSRDELSEEIHQAARDLIQRFGPTA